MSRHSSSSQVPRLPLIHHGSANGGALVVSATDGAVAESGSNTQRRLQQQQQQQQQVLMSSSRTKYTLTPRSEAEAAGARVLTPRDLQSLSAYIDANKRLSHKHRVGRASNIIPAAPFTKLREHCDASLGLALAAVNAKESALNYPLRLKAPDEYHAPVLSDPPGRIGLAARITKLLKGATSVPQHWKGEKSGTEKDVTHVNALRDMEMRVVAARRAQHTEKEAHAVFNLGSLHYNASNVERAVEQFLVAARLFEQTQDAQGAALCHNLLGVCYFRIGDAQTALLHHKRAGTFGGAYCRCVAALNIGVCYMALDQSEFALQAFSDASSDALAAGDSVLEALSAGNLGLAHMRLGEMRQAQTCVEQCLEFCSIAGDKVGASVCLLLLGEVYAAISDFEHAQFYYEHAFRVADEAKCADVAEVARVGVGVARGNLALKGRVVENALRMGRSVGLQDVLMLMPAPPPPPAPPAAGTQSSARRPTATGTASYAAPDPE